MDIRTLSLGVGAGILAATLAIGFGQSMNGLNEASQPVDIAADWKQAAEQAGMVYFPKQEYEEKLAAARAEGAKAKEAELAAKPSEPTTVQVYIQPGLGTTEVATLLQGAGVLEDGNQLIRLRSSRSNPIRSGRYNLPLKGDPEAVLKMITTPPKNP
jgi:hypothetical protein